MPPETTQPDPAYERLLAALALGEGFQFHLVTAQNPQQVRTLLNRLGDALPARRGGGSARSVYLSPYATSAYDQGLDADALISYVDAELAGLRPAPHDERLIIALDATPASEDDIPAWRRLFRRMNEQRNGFIRQIDAEFLLCLPSTLEAPFAHEAADFWSIRGVSVTLALQSDSLVGNRPGLSKDHERFPVSDTAPPRTPMCAPHVPKPCKRPRTNGTSAG